MKRLVLLFAALLVAACGEKSLSDADIERALKKAIEVDHLQQRGGAYYEANKQDPYNGWVKYMHFDSKQAEFLAQVKDGKKNGIYIEWWPSGWKRKQESYRDGLGG